MNEPQEFPPVMEMAGAAAIIVALIMLLVAI